MEYDYVLSINNLIFSRYVCTCFIIARKYLMFLHPNFMSYYCSKITINRC